MQIGSEEGGWAVSEWVHGESSIVSTIHETRDCEGLVLPTSAAATR